MISDDQPTNGNKPLIGLTQTNIWFGFRYPRTSATQARVTKNIVDSIFSKKKYWKIEDVQFVKAAKLMEVCTNFPDQSSRA